MKIINYIKNIPAKFENWLTTKPKWVQMSIGTNLGRLGIATILFLITFFISDNIFNISADASDVFFYISLIPLAYIVIFILIMCAWAVRNLIKDTKEMIKNKKK